MSSNKLFSYLTKTLAGVMVFSLPLLATDTEEDKSEQQIIPPKVGERSVSHIERVKLQESRARRIRKLESGEGLSEEEKSELSEEELAEYCSNREEKSSDSAVECEVLKKASEASTEGLSEGKREELVACCGDEGVSDEKAPEAKLMKKGFDVTVYESTHDGAWHNALEVSLLGDVVVLEDGSIWMVCSDDRYKTLDWYTDDIVIIVPNHDFFTSYDYRLINLKTGENVRVNLDCYEPPLYNGYYSYWILAIDYSNKEICLNDGSVWKMHSFDKSTIKEWLPGDTVIIGTNDGGWFSGSNPNILINVNTYEHARGKCVY